MAAAAAKVLTAAAALLALQLPAALSQYRYELVHNSSGYPTARSSVHFVRGDISPQVTLHSTPQVSLPQVPLAPTIQVSHAQIPQLIQNHDVVLEPALPRGRKVYHQPGHNFLQTVDIGGLDPVPPRPVCGQPSPTCTNSKWRTFDGSCNNLRNTEWGMAGQRYGRLVRHKYGDGVQSPPTSVTGAPLPSARAISVILFPDVEITDKRWTLVTMQWGQIITHDMSMAMGTTQSKPHATQCCYPDGHAPKSPSVSPSCYPIILPIDDPHFSRVQQSCMNFVRSTTDLAQGCGSGLEPAEQLSTVTSFLDLSLVYGNSKQMNDALRAFQNGLMITEVRNGREYPPSALNRTAQCDVQSPNEPCYQTGDVRANQNPQLTLLQIILLREHNRIASILSKLNPHWSDERTFQEARRINTAQYQHINYYEWLPLFLGVDNALRHGIIHNTNDVVHDYREDVDPSTLQGHATAAFRYFHSLIAGHLQLVQEDRQSYAALRLSDTFNRPGVIEEGTTGDDLTRGMVTQPEMASDQWFTSEITDFLFRMGRKFGSDLRAIDIQRGRDHGLGSYNDYREFCGLRRAHSFQDFGDQISAENIEKLASLYSHPDDVDYTVGGSLEAHVPGTEAGPTFLCLLTEQFYRTRVADRFFYESASNPNPFTPAQLAEIRKASVSRLFCDNGDNIQGMQPRGFDLISSRNPVVSCRQYDVIPPVDLSLWQEYPGSGEYSLYGK